MAKISPQIYAQERPMLNAFRLFKRVNLLSRKGITALIDAVRQSGVNLSAVLHVAAKLYPSAIAVVDGDKSLSYAELQNAAVRIAKALQQRYRLKPGQNVVIVSRNGTALTTALFGCARAGLDISLLTTEYSSLQYDDFFQRQPSDLILYAADINALLPLAHEETCWLSLSSLISAANEIDDLSQTALKKRSFSKITVLTAGSTGTAKAAARKSSALNFVAPLYALLDQLKIADYRSVYIATPLYHGFGLATLCVSILLGKTLYLTPKFDAASACRLISQHNIEVISLVPLMLNRMINHDWCCLSSLRCIVCGSAPLSPILARRSLDLLGANLYNLYGTSEAGLCTLATPQDLQNNGSTIGKVIYGVRIAIVDENDKPVDVGIIGRLKAKCRWSATVGSVWIDCGDLGYYDQQGYFYLVGRSDDMIISGGENVYPIVLENALLAYDEILEAAAIAIDDNEFGQRLCAFIAVKNTGFDTQRLFNWLEHRLARYQRPKEILVIDHIPLTSIGKPDKAALKAIYGHTAVEQ
jgi:fatty-acyl-CoA synthase